MKNVCLVIHALLAKNKMQLLLSDSHCVYENLAFEDYILRHTDFSDLTLLIYINLPSIVLGRFQNPWRECSLDGLNQQAIKLARRQSGGGTVFHDSGNINFCLFQKNKLVDKKILLNWIIQFLGKLSIPVKMNERFDLLATYQNSDYKVSGSAYKQTKEGSFHHCTLLVDSKLEQVKNYLHHNFDFQFSSKSIPSVRSSVINLKQISPTLTVSSVLSQLEREYNGMTVYPANIIANHAEARAFYEKMQSTDWILGETPDFVAQRQLNNEVDQIFKVASGRLTETSEPRYQKYLGTWFDPKIYT
jgi:lipoate---protein ligase